MSKFFEEDEEIESMMLDIVNEGEEETLKEKVEKEQNAIVRLKKRQIYYLALEKVKQFGE